MLFKHTVDLGADLVTSDPHAVLHRNVEVVEVLSLDAYDTRLHKVSESTSSVSNADIVHTPIGIWKLSGFSVLKIFAPSVQQSSITACCEPTVAAQSSLWRSATHTGARSTVASLVDMVTDVGDWGMVVARSEGNVSCMQS